MTLQEWIGIAGIVLAVGGQACNVYLHLRIRVAILESEQRTSEECERKFVAQKLCNERHGIRVPEMVRIR